MDAGNYQRGKLKDKKPTSATLCNPHSARNGILK
jgi:hypothetical protein